MNGEPSRPLNSAGREGDKPAVPEQDLEKSLREQVNGYVNARLQGLHEELARLHAQTNESFTRLSDRLKEESQNDAPFTLAVSDHLRLARRAGSDEASAEGARQKSSTDIAILNAAVEEIDNQRTQTDILNALVNRAAGFAPRVVFFIIKNEQAMGWRARGLEGTIGDQAVREISLPLAQDTLIGEVVNARSVWSGAAGAHTENALLLDKLGAGEQTPERIVAIPLIARQKAVAVLYADCAAMDADAINLEALETLVRVASMSVELLATQRPAPVETKRAINDLPAPQQQQASMSVRTEATNTGAEQVGANGDSPNTHAGMPTPGVTMTGAARPAGATTSELPSVGQATQITQTTPQENTDSAPAPASYASPLGSARRYGSQADADLPVEVETDEEKRLHNEARRYARLLVSEIKLYNEQKVREGREASDLYQRLQEPIDRSREMYAKRVAPPVAARYDYFHQELVNALAEGDQNKLGGNYPGTTVNA